MPRGDRTGPNGMGAMSGRQLGYCNGYETPGFTKGVPRGGGGFGRRGNFGHGRGFGGNGDFSRGYNRRFGSYAAPNYSKEDEAKLLENEITALKDELKLMENHLKELNK